MEKAKVALCEAEVGTGKTHAYLLAAVVYHLFYEETQPIVISTSTIALQKALTEEYIPQISSILLQHRIIDAPLTFAVRKGRSHYACDSRVKTYLASLRHNDRPEEQGLVEILTMLFTGACPIDLDGLPLTDYVKGCIRVERCQPACGLASVCRYHSFLKEAGRNGIDFQIANHNLVLADILRQKGGRNRLLPEHRVLIFDEAHKLLDAARQMYGVGFENMELDRLAAGIRRAVGRHPERERVFRMCEDMLRFNTLFFETVQDAAGRRYDHSCTGIVFSRKCFLALETLTEILKDLSAFFYAADQQGLVFRQLSGKVEKAQGAVFRRLLGRIQKIQEKLMALLPGQSIYWLENMGAAGCRVCSLPKQLDFLLYEDLWSRESPYVLTSATLSVGGDFSHIMRQTGIDFLGQHRIATTSKASPFDYRNHALLYLPEDMPFPEVRNRGYVHAVLEKLEGLIGQTHGHTLVLFTSYRMMGVVYQELSKRITAYPLFLMGKGRLEVIKAFRASGNGVLLASDSAGEGIDLAGDILSSVVIVKLPFPTPHPISEYEKSLHDDFYSYLSETIVPGMLVKLRQWVGRGIRQETDTCVFSILDSRAAVRYRKEILSALPDMPVTKRMKDVGRFIREHKDKDYFGRLED
ncbi:MAG: ATP-dependent DNA helicase [Lachnospiraceae bacterium]|nr:ATP-dependent DNA helicase [Lachnospiraceae bacterium]